MYKGKHTSKKRSSGKRNLGLVMAMVLLIAVAAGSTIAYLTDSSDPVVNELAPSAISCEIVETVGGGVKSSVTVKNTGKTTAFIRVAVVANELNDDGQIVGPADVSGALGNAGWVRSGMYYYYTQPVAPNGGLTGELLSSAISLDGCQVTVLAEAIQAQPADAVVSAWGVNPANLGSR